MVVMASGSGAMVSARLTDLVWTGLPESVTLKVIALLFAGADGVPVTAPVDGLKARPVGKPPAVTAQVNGGVPPVAASEAE